jgi:hypothetical protein
LFDVRDVFKRITVGSGKTMDIKIESLRCNVEQVNENIFQVLLQEFKDMPELWVNLLSMNKSLKNVFKIGNEDIIIHLARVLTILSFERVLNAKNGFVSVLSLNPISIKISGNVVDSKKYEVKFDINKLHKAIGNCEEEALRITAKSYFLESLKLLKTFVGKSKEEYIYKQ